MKITEDEYGAFEAINGSIANDLQDKLNKTNKKWDELKQYLNSYEKRYIGIPRILDKMDELEK